jgi:hypothetical protein
MTEKETKDNSKKRGEYKIKKENLKLLLIYLKKIKENETPKS